MSAGRILIIVSLTLFLCTCNHDPPGHFLSHLDADKSSPLYTTYAAAMERSEFALDEGYEFHFYSPEEGIDFITDTGGDIGLGFIINGNWIYKEKDMFQKPVINMSYPDLVQYYYYPIEGLRIEAFFLVQSSHAAILDLKIINETTESLSLSVIPFIRNGYRHFFDIQMPDNKTFSFQHEEFPDGWTLSHELPYEDTVRNIFKITRSDYLHSFNIEDDENPVFAIPQYSDRPVGLLISGRAFQEGERVMEKAPEARIQIFPKDNPAILITENSLPFGLNKSTINNDGYFRVEMGNFPEPMKNRPFTFRFYSSTFNSIGQYDTAISVSSRIDIDLEPYDLPEIPSNVDLTWTDSTMLLEWSGNESLYRIYKRKYPESSYFLVGETSENHYSDSEIKIGQINGYLIVAVNQDQIGMHSEEVRNIPRSSFKEFIEGNKDSEDFKFAKILSFKTDIVVPPESTDSLRLVRLVGRSSDPFSGLNSRATSLLKEPLLPYIEYNESLFQQALSIEFKNEDQAMLYWSSFNMMRQVFLPPEAKSSYNYYVFSREPTWGWGHGGQVFHESIAMLAYAYLDPESAMNSQRVYSERQYDNGYINYRTGSYLDEIIEHEGQLTSSAPWYAWQNWEVYQITQDRDFLEEMYTSSKAFYHFFVSNRDADGDGLCEWGGHAVLESVRDALVAVWDEVAWPTNFDGVDVNSMLVMEAKSLEAMAMELGKEEEAAQWKLDWESRSQLINQYMWDDETGFYYNIDKNDNDFSFKDNNDLKRQEIIGFLPMWAGIATEEQAEKLVDNLLNQDKFWRKFGVPTLAADDPYYNDKGYWNGPVWVEWNLFIVQGLLNYGYKKEAEELVNRVSQGMIHQLKQTHNLWEFYSPDQPWAGYHKTYIWAGVINRMMMEGGR